MNNIINNHKKVEKRGKKIYRFLFRVFLLLIILAALGVAFIWWYDKTGQKADPSFDATIQHPAYIDKHPVILFDTAHFNFHTPIGRYAPLADLLHSDGYRIKESVNPITTSLFDSVSVFLIANAMGPRFHEERDAFTENEDSVIVQWVRAGGSLLLIADHAPFGAAVSKLSECFGVTMYLRYARDDKFKSGWDNERLLFSRSNGLLTSCSITNGRNKMEAIKKVVTFTGQSLSVPATAIPLLIMGPESYDWESRKKRFPAKGHAQGIMMPFGKGRVVILGEAGMLSAQLDPLGFKMGMNDKDNDNRQFALNIIHWLSQLF